MDAQQRELAFIADGPHNVFIALCSAASVAKGRCPNTASATQGECSKMPPSAAANCSRVARLIPSSEMRPPLI